MAVDNKSKKNTIYSLIRSLSAVIFPLITFPYASRILGVENYGKINFASSIVTYFALIASLGITTLAIRECGKVKDDKEKLGKLASRFLSINILSTILSYILLIACVIIFATLKQYFWLIFIFSFTIVFNTLGADWLNMAVGDFKYIAIRGLVANILALVFMFIFVHHENDYIVYSIITVTASSGVQLLNVLHRRKYCKVVPTLKLNLKKTLPPILLMFSIVLVQEVFVSSDKTIIGILLDDNAVGLYSAANKIYTLPSTFTNSLTNVLLPILSAAYATNDMDKVKSTQKYGLNYLFLIGLPCTAGLVFFSSEIINFASGQAYITAGPTLSILGIAYLFSLFGNFITNFNLISRGKDKICFIACLISALLNVGLNFLLIPKFGITAAAFTTALSQFVILIIEWPFVDRKNYDKSFLKVMLKPFISTLVLIAWLFLVKYAINNPHLTVIFGVFVGAINYFAVNLLLKEEMTTDFCKNVIRKLNK